MLNSRESPSATYLIGGIFSTTGYLSWLGTCKKRTAQFLEKVINEAGGVNGNKIKLIWYDDCSSARVAERIAEYLINRKRVITIIGTCSVPVSLSVARVANKYKVPLFLSSGYLINPRVDEFVFNTAHGTDTGILKSFMYLKDLGARKLALLMPRGPLGEVGAQISRLVAGVLGQRIVVEEWFDLKAVRLGDYTRRILSFVPDAVFCFVTGKPAVRVVKAFYEAGCSVPILLSHGNASRFFFESLPPVDFPVLIPTGKIMAVDNLPSDDPCRDVIVRFNSLHLMHTGEKADYHAAEVADAFQIVTRALKTGASTPVEIKEAVEGLSFTGLQGIYRFSKADHHGTEIRDVVILEYRCGELQARSLPDVQRASRGGLHFLRGSSAPRSRGDTFTFRGKTEGSKDRGQVEALASPDYVGMKSALAQCLRSGDGVHAQRVLDDLISYLKDLHDAQALKLGVFEISALLLDLFKEVATAAEVRLLRSHFLKSWLSVDEKEQLSNLLRELFRLVLTRVTYGGKGGELLHKVVNFIEANLSQKLKLNLVARSVGLSSSYMSRMLRKRYGITFTGLLTRLRIQRAIQLLATTDLSVSSVAHRLGFSDQSYFTKVFRKHTNLTPRTFRRNPLGNYRLLKGLFETN